MPYSTTWSPRGVTWTFIGTVTGEELMRANREVWDDARFPDIRYQIVDMTRVEHFDVTADVMLELARRDHIAALTNASIRIAVAAHSDLIRALSLHYEAASSDSPWTQHMFESLAEAEAWAKQTNEVTP